MTPACGTQVTISLKGKEKRNNRKAYTSRSEEKVVCFSSASLLRERKREAVTSVETTGIDNPMWRITRGADIIKGWEDKRDHEGIPYIPIRQEYH